MANSPKPDPTDNVRELLALSTERTDSLRLAEQQRVNELMDAERRRVNEQMQLRAEYDAQLALAEAKRIDAIRAVDVAAVAVANERATAQAVVLANQVSVSAETLRSLVASTAATQATQLTQLTTQLTDRLASLEKSQYESKGSGTGMRDMYAWIVAAVMGLVTIGSVLFNVLHH
jgi:cell division septum initiation protein DivIVA